MPYSTAKFISMNRGVEIGQQIEGKRERRKKKSDDLNKQWKGRSRD